MHQRALLVLGVLVGAEESLELAREREMEFRDVETLLRASEAEVEAWLTLLPIEQPAIVRAVRSTKAGRSRLFRFMAYLFERDWAQFGGPGGHVTAFF